MFAGWKRGRGRPRHTSHAFVHGGVGQAVGFFVVAAENVADGKPAELCNQFFGASVEVLQCGILDFVDALDLPYQQFGVADHLERLVAVGHGILECGDQALVLSKIVGLMTKIFAERGNFSPGFILNDDAVSGRSGIAARTAVAESNEVVLGRVFVRAEQFFGSARWEYEGMAKVYTAVVSSAELCSAWTGEALVLTISSFQIVVEPCGQAFDHVAPVFGLEELVPFAGIDYQLRFHA